jgi:hypothetical protein
MYHPYAAAMGRHIIEYEKLDWGEKSANWVSVNS